MPAGACQTPTRLSVRAITPATAPDGGCDTIVPGCNGSSTRMFGNQAPACVLRRPSWVDFHAAAVPMSTTLGGGSTTRNANLSAHTRAASAYTVMALVWCRAFGSVVDGRTRSGRQRRLKNGSRASSAVTASLKTVDAGWPAAVPSCACLGEVTCPPV